MPASRRGDPGTKPTDPEEARAARIEARKEDPRNPDPNAGWTAQSEEAYVPTEQVPGQVVLEEELPDKEVLAETVEDPDAYLAGVYVEGDERYDEEAHASALNRRDDLGGSSSKSSRSSGGTTTVAKKDDK